MKTSIVKAIREAYSLDFRSLALFRILVGCGIIVNLTSRSFELTNHYTDLGVLPTAAFHNFLAEQWTFSFHAWSGSFIYIALLFILHGLFAVLFTVGFKTKLMNVLLFLFTCSLQNRIWVVNSGGDDLLRLLLFVCIFLPLNRRASVDYALSNNKDDETKNIFNFWCLFFIFQLLGPYYFSAILKSSSLWNINYTATYFALRLKIFAMPLGQWLLQFEDLLKVLTFFAIYLEWAGSLLVLFNFILFKYVNKFRIYAVFIFMSFHLALIFMLNLGMFPIFMIFFWTAFLPTIFWENIFLKLVKNDNYKIKIYYDRDCGFCKKFILLIKYFFLLPTTKMVAAQDDEVTNKLMVAENSWVVINNDGVMATKFSAMITVFRASPILKYTVLLIDNPLIRKIGEKIYWWVSNNRNKVSYITKWISGTVFKPLKFNILSNIFAVYCIICITYWNIGHIPNSGLNNSLIKTSIEYLNLSQKWNLFSPFPRNINTWLEVQGVTENGEFWDLLTNSTYTGIDAAKKFHDIISNSQWRKYYLTIMDNKFYLKLYAEHLCRKWNLAQDRPTDSDLQRFKIFLYSERIMPDGEVANSSRRLVWSHYCF